MYFAEFQHIDVDTLIGTSVKIVMSRAQREHEGCQFFKKAHVLIYIRFYDHTIIEVTPAILVMWTNCANAFSFADV